MALAWYGWLADLVVAIHAMYVAAVVFGLVAVLLGAALGWLWIRHFWFRIVHFAMIALVVAESLLGIPCPLTELEYQLRKAAGQSVQSGSFVGRCLQDLMFFDWPSWVFTLIYCAFASLVLGTWIFLPPQRRARLTQIHETQSD